MNRRPHARPLTRREAERLGLYLAPRQPRRVRHAWPDATWTWITVLVLAALVGALVPILMGDLVWVRVP